MNDPIEPEELTELLDDDLEMWAMGGTRILPKSQLTPSYPPVAYTPESVPPPAPANAVARPRSSAPVWAAVAGMTGVFAIAAIAGAVVLFMRSEKAPEPADTNASTVSAASTSTSTVTSTTTDTDTVTVTPTEKVAPTLTDTKTATTSTPVVSATPKLGAVQTWSAGNGKPIYVDGKEVGVGGSHVKTACGKHSVRVGSGKAKTYDIPCSGNAIVVGTPDGQ
jgi:hypothetical protein